MKCCEFLEDVYDEKELIWIKDKGYPVTFEDKKLYYFGKPLINSISKEFENELFKIVIIEED